MLVVASAAITAGLSRLHQATPRGLLVANAGIAGSDGAGAPHQPFCAEPQLAARGRLGHRGGRACWWRWQHAGWRVRMGRYAL